MKPTSNVLVRSALGAIALAAAAMSLIHAQPPSTTPPTGLRDNTPAIAAFTNAKIVTEPGQTIERGTLVIRDGVIEDVGADVKPPEDARIFNLDGKTIYPGLIDAYTELAPEASSTDPALAPQAGAKYWNTNVTPQVRADRIYSVDGDTNRKLRAQGVVARLAAPGKGIIKGTSALVSTGDGDPMKLIIRDRVAQHAQLTVDRRGGGGRRGRPTTAESTESNYPDSPMGAFTLVRQALYDAQWYGKAWEAHNNDSSIPRPEQNDALAALLKNLDDKFPFIIDSENELYFARADKVAREFDLNLIVVGSGNEFKRLEDVKATGRSIILPVNFPRPPSVNSPESALGVSLDEMMQWDIAPENPARLDKAGVKFALSSHGLRDKAMFLGNVRKAVVRGLAAESALRAMTTNASELLGASSLGSLAKGKSASFVITDGELFNEKTKVLETWVEGKRYEIVPTPAFDPRGKWAVKLGAENATITIGGEIERFTGKIEFERPASQPASAPAVAPEPETQPTAEPEQPQQPPEGDRPRGPGARGGAGRFGRAGGRGGPGGENDFLNQSLRSSLLTFNYRKDKQNRESPITQVSITLNPDDTWLGEGVRPDGTTFPITARKIGPASRPTSEPTSQASTQNSKKEALYAVNYPFGDFGREKLPEQTKAIVFTNATVWTAGPKGTMENTNVVVENGKISRIYQSQEAYSPPGDAVVIDCRGKCLAPGIIDCHSHSATDGGVNEGGQTITAEVRIGDFINPNDMNIYRQLAGGVTAANVLHGSANTIGGQNQVIKLRWGANADEMKFKEAPPGIKFALGENPKQSNGDRESTRYPQSRMGVEELVRDEFKAALDYKKSWEDYKSNPKGVMPPRRDLELDAIVEILDHKRWIHCHSYRQDEILALLRTLESFNVQIGTLQHILEGYKVADAMAKHGAMASSFADWWAYKFEVYDAIPYNGAIMHDAGIVVSFNSDDGELARRLNLEAAKAVKYGGVPPEEAIKFVTLNPARQLRIDHYVGSIEEGKDADICVWSGSPLSAYSHVEQTWIDGRKYFDRSEDLKMRERAQQMRAALVQRILTSGEEMTGPGEADNPRVLWPDEDIYCGHSDHAEEGSR